MNKDHRRRDTAKGGAAANARRTGKNDCPVVVVGIGTSASGLESLKQIFARMAPGHGVAFVLIQHMEPSQKSLTVKRLRDQMALAVVEATDGMPVLADRIHVIPPDKFLSIAECRLTLLEPVLCNGLRMPIDHFFCSLAADQRRRGCGILLSGTGSDGTLGLSEINSTGGRTLVEEPRGAEFPSIPQSAINAGVVDEVLPAEKMAEAIRSLAEQIMAETRSNPAESPEFDADLRAVLDILHEKVGHDFRCYKPNTLVRRIRRRMTLGNVATFGEYARFLREHPEQVSLLQKDLLIGVSEFFRQPQAWNILEEKVITALVDAAQPGSEIRAWVPGCSTGNEAYSLAMLLTERLEESGKKVGIQIFATDSDAAALTTARSGIYSKEEIGENVSPQRLKRFFTRKNGRYQVIKRIRAQIVFAPQNLTADPPFSKLVLISCRNLLIYLEQPVQKKIIALFHFALREGGFLFLGPAETVGDREDLFEPVSKKWRIYRRIGVGRPVSVEIPVRPGSETQAAGGTFSVATSAPRLSLASTAQQMLLDRFAPACVMIDRKLHVLYVHGAVEDYLTFPAGELTTRVVDMAREGLRARLRGAIDKCLEVNRSVSVTTRVRRGEKSVSVKATLTPLRYPREADGLLLVAFEDCRVSSALSRGKGRAESDARQIEDELKITREELQSTIEQLEISNDQLKASNEEVTAANEELQSANEEMETSKEELQILNEELNTINSRLQEKVEELEDTNNDIVNLLSSTSIATVFLDKELKVRRYTPASTHLLSLIPSDVGRAIADVLRRFSDDALLDDARRVLADLTPLFKEVHAEDGRWHIRRITPYRTQDDRIEGVVITFVDVSDLKEAEETLNESRRRLGVIVDSIADGFYALDREWRFTHINDAALRHFRKSREEMVGRGLFEVFPATRGTVFEAEFRRAMESGNPVQFEGPSTISDRMVELHAYPGPDNMTVLFRDVTERHRTAQALREAHERAAWLALFPEDNPSPVLRASAGGNVLYRNPASAEVPGWACEVGKPLPGPLGPLVGQAMTEKQEVQQDVELGGRFYTVAVTPFPADGYANIYGRDITERKRGEQELLRAKQEWERTFDAVPDLIAILDDRHRILRANKAMAQRLGLPPDQCAGRLCYQAVHGLDRAPDFCPHSLTLADGQEHVSEVHEDCLGGDFLVSTTPLSDEQGRRIGSVHVARDITRSKLREEQIARLTKLYAVLSRVNETIVRTHDEDPLFKEVCRIVAEEGEFPLVWIGQLNGRQVAPVAWHGPASEYLKEIRVEVDGELGTGPTGTSIREDRPVINDDFDSNPSAAPWRKPALRYGFRASAGFPLHRQGRAVGALTLYGPQPGAFDAEQVKLLEALCADISYALDAFQQEKLRREAERTLRENEERLRLLSETAGRLLVAENPQGIVNDLCREVMAHLDCQAFFNFLVDESTGRLHLNAYAGIPEEEAQKVKWLDYGVAVCGCVAQEGHPIVAEDIRDNSNPRTNLVKSYGIQAYACHPLMVQGKLIGTLSFGTGNRPNFRPEELAIMKTVTDQVATAMERMKLIQELQRSRDRLEVRVQERTAELEKVNETLRYLSSKLLSAQEEERKRIAGELHDSIGACLTGIKFRVEKAMLQIGGTESAAAESLNTIIPVIQEAVEECRRIQMDLRPSMLDDLGLRATLSWFCRGFQKVYSEIQVDQEFDVEEGEVPSSLKIVSFRLIQEAMNNVAKHSHANHVRLSLRKREGRIELIIHDNGRGFRVEKNHSQDPAVRGLGLLSMRERTELSSGSFAIESTVGKGTIIRASWPLGKE